MRLGKPRPDRFDREALRERLHSVALSCLQHLKTFAHFLLYCFWPDFKAPERSNKVAYLDGIRGFAALLVWCEHNFHRAHYGDKGHMVIAAYGANGEYYLAAFPFLRLFFAGGGFAVSMFFVISGYAITISPLKKLQSGQHTRLLADLGAAFPKRFLRLYIPVLGTSFCYMTIWQMFNLHGLKPEDEEVFSYGGAIVHWAQTFFAQSFYFVQDGFKDKEEWYRHIWTIPVETRGSFTVYVMLLVCLSFYGWGTKARLWAQAGLLFYLMFLVDGWYLALFISGMLLCDLDLLSESGQLPHTLSRLKQFSERGRGVIFYIMFFIGLWLAGVPGGTFRKFEGYGELYHVLALLNPSASSKIRRFFLVWAAIILMICIPRVPFVRRFFESRFCQYLGKVSFSLYLVHGAFLATIAERVYIAVGCRPDTSKAHMEWKDALPLPAVGPTGFEVNFLLAQLVLWPIVFYIAGVSTKMFDTPSVEIARWLCDPSRTFDHKSHEVAGHEYELVEDELLSEADTEGPEMEMAESHDIDSPYKPRLSESS